MSGGEPVEGDGEVTVSVSVDIPQVVPFWDLGTVTETATMPRPRPGDLGGDLPAQPRDLGGDLPAPPEEGP
ncbi:hypothetical protein [Streptomyces hydrogenans]|uniref:hypothetical protein n=1 Tax=Streptomyces hydrogenans TaxID=1873719 RepID=UPI003443F355